MAFYSVELIMLLTSVVVFSSPDFELPYVELSFIVSATVLFSMIKSGLVKTVYSTFLLNT